MELPIGNQTYYYSLTQSKTVCVYVYVWVCVDVCMHAWVHVCVQLILKTCIVIDLKNV